MSAEKPLIERHRAVMPSWLALYYDEPLALDRGGGRHVWDSDGTRYLDFFGGILTTMSGHNIPEIVDAIRDQAGKLRSAAAGYEHGDAAGAGQVLSTPTGGPR